MTSSSVLRGRPWAVGAGLIGLVMLAVYVALIISQGSAGFFEVLPWALLMATATVLALAGARIANRRIARNVLLGATALFGVIGVVSLLTIGLTFIIAALATGIAAARLPSGPGD